MRTTVTLDPDVAARLRAVAHERGTSFKVALNDAVRAGLSAASPSRRPFTVHALPPGFRQGVNVDKALRLAGELEDAEILRRLELRK